MFTEKQVYQRNGEVFKEAYDSLPEGDPSQNGFVFLLMLVLEVNGHCGMW